MELFEYPRIFHCFARSFFFEKLSNGQMKVSRFFPLNRVGLRGRAARVGGKRLDMPLKIHLKECQTRNPTGSNVEFSYLPIVPLQTRTAVQI